MKRLCLISFASAIVAAGSANLFAQMPPTLVETSAVGEMEFRDDVTLVGRTDALSNSRVVSEITGRVMRIDAPEGNRVARGDALVSIDPERVRIALEAKRAEAAQAKAAMDLAEKELARAEDLRGQDLVAEGFYDLKLSERDRAREYFNQQTAEQKRLELDLASCTIRAPFDGYTVRKLTDVGQWVEPGTPVYEVVDLSRVKVTIDLPERYFGQVEKGVSAAISIAGQGEPAVGVVTGLAPSATPETHTFPVIVTVDNIERRLGAGMLVRATLSLKGVHSSLAVHKDAIVRQGDQTMVYTIADGKAQPIRVKVGSTMGEMVAVEGQGLSSGMVVVVRGNERIFPGSPVRVAEPGGQGPNEAGQASPDGN